MRIGGIIEQDQGFVMTHSVSNQTPTTYRKGRPLQIRYILHSHDVFIQRSREGRSMTGGRGEGLVWVGCCVGYFVYDVMCNGITK